MSNAGQAVLTVVGTVVGSFFGNPQLGYLLGSLAGQALFPTDLGTVQGPRLNELTMQTSTVGAPIPMIYGVFALSGNVIWSEGLTELKNKKKVGGKGGPTQTQVTFTYSVSCAIGFCERCIGYRRIWADTKLLYDAREQQPDEADDVYFNRMESNSAFLAGCEMYFGTREQMPDPTIEAVEGIGNVSGFRDLAYIVFTDFQLADYGNRIPNFRVEAINVPFPDVRFNPQYAVFTGNALDLGKDETQNTPRDIAFGPYIGDTTNPIDPTLPPIKPSIYIQWYGPAWHFGGGEGIGDEIQWYTIKDLDGNGDPILPYRLFDKYGVSTLNMPPTTLNIYGPIGPGFQDDFPNGVAFNPSYTSMWFTGGDFNGLTRYNMEMQYNIATAERSTNTGFSNLWGQISTPRFSGDGRYLFLNSGTEILIYRLVTPFEPAVHKGFDYHLESPGDPAGTEVVFNGFLPEGASFPGSTQALRVERSATAAANTYTQIGTNGVGNYDLVDPIPFTERRRVMVARMWWGNTGMAGRAMRIRVRSEGSATIFTEAEVIIERNTIGPETLTFDFGNVAGGIPLDFTRTYNQIEIEFAHGLSGAAIGALSIYMQDLSFPPVGTLHYSFVKPHVEDTGDWYPLQFLGPAANSPLAVIRYSSLPMVFESQLIASNGSSVIQSGIGITFDPTGMEMHLSGDMVFWYHLMKPWDITTAILSGWNEGFNAQDAAFTNIIWAPTGHAFWALGANTGKLYEYLIVPPPPTEIRIPLGEIVRDVNLRCGLLDARIDVTDLIELVDGYAIARPMAGRDAITPLRPYGMFDCVESNGMLKWPIRGKPIVAALGDVDLAAHVSDDARPAAVETSRMQEMELPRRLRVHYTQVNMNYEAGEQSASRMAAGDVEVRDLEVAVVMTDEKAAKIAEVSLYDLWVSRNGHKFQVGREWSWLEPADAISIPIDGRQERLRLLNVGYIATGLLQIAAVRDDDGVYQSYALGSTPAYSGTGGGSLAMLGTAELILLNIPMLRDADDNPGYYGVVVARGSNTFSGMALFRSPDGGITYASVATTDTQATVGTVRTALPPGPTTIVDEGNELIIDGLLADSLESAVDASLNAGLNSAVIGVEGRWEVIQFQLASLMPESQTSWLLTGLRRGRRGTEWAVGTSQAGDTFVLLNDAVMDIPMSLSALHEVKKHKPVLVGRSLAETAEVDFAGAATRLMPFAPVHVEGELYDGDFVIGWTRRGRIGSELTSGADIPLSEETESYEVDIYAGASVVRTLHTGVPSVAYTEEQIAEDFGGVLPDPLVVKVYQMSASVGRGYAAEAAL